MSFQTCTDIDFLLDYAATFRACELATSENIDKAILLTWEEKRSALMIEDKNATSSEQRIL